MKYKKVLLFFWIALPVSVVMRLLQLLFTIDTRTGFFKPEYENIGFYLLIMIVAICAVTVCLCFTTHRNPVRPPEQNRPLGVVSLIMAVALTQELFTESFAGTVLKWQSAALAVTGLAAVVYFAVAGVGSFVRLNYPPILTVIPTVYFVIRIICFFTSVSSLALITDNILLLACYCTALVFFLCYGKAYHQIDADRNFRKLLAAGLSAVIFCMTQSVPHFIVNFMTGNGYLHTSNSTSLSVLVTGLYIAVFLFTHFSAKNCAAE